jgi:hypothetical protein
MVSSDKSLSRRVVAQVPAPAPNSSPLIIAIPDVGPYASPFMYFSSPPGSNGLGNIQESRDSAIMFGALAAASCGGKTHH